MLFGIEEAGENLPANEEDEEDEEGIFRMIQLKGDTRSHRQHNIERVSSKSY
jgi:hypothetical protein